MIELLIASGANISTHANQKQTPYYWAVKRGHKGIIDLLYQTDPFLTAGGCLEIREGRKPVIHPYSLKFNMQSLHRTEMYANEMRPFVCVARMTINLKTLHILISALFLISMPPD